MIYLGDGKIIDQNYCAVECDGSDVRGIELDLDRGSFTYAYRYVGNK